MQQEPPEEDIREFLAKSVEMVMRHRNWSASEAARQAGVAASTITRLLNPAGKFVPSHATAAKIRKLVYEHTVHSARDVSEAYKGIDKSPSKATISQLRGVPLVGRIQAGAWVERVRPDPAEQPVIGYIDLEWRPGSVVAYELADDYSHPNFPQGTYVFVDVDEDGKNSRTGDVALISRRAEFLGSTKVELALWRVEEDVLEVGDRRLVNLADRSTNLSFEVDGDPYIRDLDVVGVCVGFYVRRGLG